jgi:hypothetical protein
VQKLRDAANNEIDQDKQKQLSIQATAAAREGEAEKAMNIARAKEAETNKEIEYERRLRDERYSARETYERAHGEGYTAQKDEIERRYQDRMEEIKENKEHYSSNQQDQLRKDTGADRAADLDSLKENRQRELRGIGEQTSEYEWQSANRPRMADLSHIASDIDEQLRQHKDDPEMQWELRQEGAAQLTAFAHPESKSEWYSSAGDYAKSLQTGVLNQDGDASKQALEAAKELKEGVKDWRHLMENAQGIAVLHDMSP